MSAGLAQGGTAGGRGGVSGADGTSGSDEPRSRDDPGPQRSYGSPGEETVAQPGPVPYGTARGLPPPAAYPYGTQTGPGPRPAAPETGPGNGADGSTVQPRTDASRHPSAWPAGQARPPDGPPVWGQPGSGPAPVGSAAPVDPVDVARATRLGRLAVFNALVGLFFSFTFFPIGLIFDVLAIVLGIKARRAAVLVRRGEGAGVLAVVLGSVGVALATVLAMALAVFWSEVQTYWDCTSGANTNTARTECNSMLEADLLRRLGLDN